MIGRAALLLGLLVIGTGCQSRKPQGNTAADPGARLYVRSCGGCHGPNGRGLTRPGLRVKPPDLTREELQSTHTDADLASIIKHGRGQMPPFAKLLDDAELALIVQHLRALRTQR